MNLDRRRREERGTRRGGGDKRCAGMRDPSAQVPPTLFSPSRRSKINPG
jgi:hypothetical protein